MKRRKSSITEMRTVQRSHGPRPTMNRENVDGPGTVATNACSTLNNQNTSDNTTVSTLLISHEFPANCTACVAGLHDAANRHDCKAQI